MVDVQRIESPEVCLECGGEGEMVLATVNASLSICDCGTLCVRVDRPEKDGLVSYFHWFSPLTITVEPEEDD